MLDAWLLVSPADGHAWALRADTHDGDEFEEMLVERYLARALAELPDEPRLLARRAEILARWWSKTLVALRDAERAARLAPDDPVVLRAAPAPTSRKSDTTRRSRISSAPSPSIPTISPPTIASPAS